jgi:hypothetical protein
VVKVLEVDIISSKYEENVRVVYTAIAMAKAGPLRRPLEFSRHPAFEEYTGE